MMFKEIKDLIRDKFPESIVGEDLDATPHALIITPDTFEEVCYVLRDQEGLYFDCLSCLTAIDLGPDSGGMEVIYNLYSIPYDHHLMIKVKLNRNDPSIDSVGEVWKTALWHEREAYDLMGIRFSGHPDLRRILLPEDWEGHPLRKDYEEQEYYHGVRVRYE